MGSNKADLREAVFFSGLPTEHMARNDADASARFCIASLRIAEHLLGSVPLIHVPVTRFEAVTMRPWGQQGQQQLNSDYGLRSYQGSSAMFRGHLLPVDARDDDIWLITRGGHQELLENAARAGLPARIIDYRPSLLRSTRRLTLVDVGSRPALTDLLWPNHLAILHDSLAVLLERPATGTFGSVTVRAGADPFAGVLNGCGFERVFEPYTARSLRWVATQTWDLTILDAGDPVFCVPAHLLPGLLGRLLDLASANGFCTHSVPLLSPLAWNWTGFGEIPCVQPAA